MTSPDPEALLISPDEEIKQMVYDVGTIPCDWKYLATGNTSRGQTTWSCQITNIYLMCVQFPLQQNGYGSKDLLLECFVYEK